VAAKAGDEVDAALEVLGLSDLKGKIVTGDALHCNRRMVETIVAKGGDYCIALKDNQESLLSDARACLAKVGKNSPQPRPRRAGMDASRRASASWSRPRGSHNTTNLPA
jgi:predicted transposase YbfD/YdcC